MIVWVASFPRNDPLISERDKAICLARDLLDYQERRRYERRAALDELTEISEDAGAYEATATPQRTR